jgi:hypothetical protein
MCDSVELAPAANRRLSTGRRARAGLTREHDPALAIGRLAIANAVIRKLRAEEIEIGSLKVRELEVAGKRWPETPPASTQA